MPRKQRHAACWSRTAPSRQPDVHSRHTMLHARITPDQYTTLRQKSHHAHQPPVLLSSFRRRVLIPRAGNRIPPIVVCPPRIHRRSPPDMNIRQNRPTPMPAVTAISRPYHLRLCLSMLFFRAFFSLFHASYRISAHAFAIDSFTPSQRLLIHASIRSPLW